MVRTPSAAGPAPTRRGAILIVVLALLALFAVVGLSFIFYADSEATAARIYREGQGQNTGPSAVVPPDGGEIANQAIGYIVYGTGDTGKDLFNALRNHSLAENIYGWSGKAGAHAVPFDGAGLAAFKGEAQVSGVDRDQVVNFTFVNGQVVDANWSGTRATLTTAPAVGSRPYVGRNAGYTYPDLNNFFLASLDPRTGEVLVPSFHRPWLFGDLGPSGGNWAGPAGRMKTLRPRPSDNVNQVTGKMDFPMVPQNPADPANPSDPTYTGDVQNLIGGVGVQKNDSLWMDIGLEPFTWNGKRVKALIAPLIVDLDGRVNVNVVGNQRSSGTGRSYHGFGPWEINPSLLLGGEAANVVRNRAASPRPQNAAISSRYFLPPTVAGAGPQPIPAYSQVNWGALSNSPYFELDPAGTSMRGVPSYVNFDNNTDATNANAHPSLFTATEWPAPISPPSSPTFAFLSPGTYPHTDLKRLEVRYANKPDWYDPMYLGGQAPNSLRGSTSFSATDQAHGLRMGVTTLSTGFAVPMAQPIMLDYANTATTLRLVSAAGMQPDTSHPTAGTSATTAYPAASLSGSASTTLGVSDFDGQNKMWVNRMAALGGVDLNRKLADYRTNTNAGLSSTNANDGTQAWADRHNLARDVFARLIIATGANAKVNPATGDVTVLATPSTAGTPDPQYEALRYLAQLSANIVDQVDGDDVSTPFVWYQPSGLKPVDAFAVSGQLGAYFQTADAIRTNVVFGVERPRLVVNEAYGEYVNDPDDTFDPGTPPKPPATKPIQVRFWVELLNPSQVPYMNQTGAADKPYGPLGDGAVDLVANNTSPYQVLVVRDDATGSVQFELRKPDNTAGALPPGFTPQIKLDLAQNTDAAGRRVMPNVTSTDGGLNYTCGGQPTPGPNNGFVVLAPKVKDSANNDVKMRSGDPLVAGFVGDVIRVTDATPLDTTKVDGGTQSGLTYLRALPTKDELKSGQTFPLAMQKHIVVLRRLANPFLPANDPDAASNPGGTAFDPSKLANPFVTVDFMNYVPSADAVYMAKEETEPRKSKAESAGDGYDPKGEADPSYRRYAVGRVQPFAGSYTKTMAAPKPGEVALVDHLMPQDELANDVYTTFGRHNGKSSGQGTLAYPADWLPHFDRPLSNSLELLMVSCRKPHELTQTFIPIGVDKVNSTPGPNAAGGHLARWIEGTNPAVAVDASNPSNGLYRALDLLRVAPWDFNTPLGGKVHGRINWNTVQDPRVFAAALDTASNSGLTALNANIVWNTLATSRTPKTRPANPPGGTPGTSYVADNNAAKPDVPFQPAGAAQYTDGGTLRGLPQLLQRPPTGGTTPAVWVPAATHPYFQSEAARKLWNNSTTVSNAFAVWVTVGFFEVATDATGKDQIEPGTAAVGGGSLGRPILGKEAYKEVPGDLRQQYFAVVDRTNLTLDPADPTFAGTPGTPPIPPKPGPVPFFTSLEDAVPQGGTASIRIKASGGGAGSVTVYADGQPIKIVSTPVPAATPPSTDTNVLFIGTGPAPANTLGVPTNRERATVTEVTGFDPATGVATLKVSGLTQYHPAGALVTNAVPGHPGPQGAVSDISKPEYKPVVPLFTRLR